MGRKERRWEDAAAAAVAYAVEEAVTAIGQMSYKRQPTQSGVFPTDEYQEQIRRLAEICTALVPGLARDPERKPTQVLKTAWGSLNEDQQRWLHASFQEGDHDLRAFLS
ncbi:hypothetical protein ACWGID_22880 [Kribbella sp. NPDC054772]